VIFESHFIRLRPPRSSAVALLESQGLPVSDLTDAHLENFFCSGDDGSPTGLVGLEICQSVALLRSLVVAENARARGLGSARAHYAEQYAGLHNIQSMYLLTTTVESFFARLGYRRLDHAQAPAPIVQTSEFSHLCPSTSAFNTTQAAAHEAGHWMGLGVQ
jgi:amino-acid N-acetyltransferase